MSSQSEDIDDDRTEALDDSEWNNFESPGRDYVNSLLDISEEYYVKEQEPYEVQIPEGWEEAVRGWGRFAPLACLFLVQRKRKKVTANVTNSHRHPRADLKVPKRYKLPDCTCAGHFFKGSEEPLKNSFPSSTELSSKLLRNSWPCSSLTSEENNPIVEGGATGTAAFDETLDTDGQQEKAVPYRSSSVDQIYQGSQTSKYLMSIPVSRNEEGTLPQASPILSQNLKQAIPYSHIFGPRAHSNFKVRSPKGAEPELLMLQGTKMHISVSGRRLM